MVRETLDFRCVQSTYGQQGSFWKPRDHLGTPAGVASFGDERQGTACEPPGGQKRRLAGSWQSGHQSRVTGSGASGSIREMLSMPITHTGLSKDNWLSSGICYGERGAWLV